MKDLTITTSNTEYGNILDKVAAYIGAPPLGEPEKLVLIDFFKSEFRTVRPDEFLEAVKGVISGRIETARDISRIQRLSSGWWGAILQGYRAYRRNQNRLNDPITPESLSVERISQFTGIDGKERGYYETLEKWYLEHGNTLPPFGWAYGHARKWLKDNGLLVKAEDKAEVERLAIEHMKSLPTILKSGRMVKRKLEQIYLDRAVCELHLKRKFTIG